MRGIFWDKLTSSTVLSLHAKLLVSVFERVIFFVEVSFDYRTMPNKLDTRGKTLQTGSLFTEVRSTCSQCTVRTGPYWLVHREQSLNYRKALLKVIERKIYHACASF